MADENTATVSAAKGENRPAQQEKQHAPQQEGAVAEPLGRDTEMKDISEETHDGGEGPVDHAVSDDRAPQKPSDSPGEALARAADQVATSAERSKATRRKSGTPGAVKKKLSKKGSKAKILHLDAKPGNYFFVKLKGYPTWPVIVCSEDMLPHQLLKTRPVSAAHSDGSYRHDFAEGGKRVADRSFPVMYLQTNEFGWVCNQDLHDLDPNVVMDQVSDKMRRDLQEAYALAAEQYPLDHFKELLLRFEQEKEEQAVAKAAAAAAKKAKKSKAPSPSDGDMSVPDATEDEDGKPKFRKRKAHDEAQALYRSDSTKKPKIKLTTAPKPANGLLARSGKESSGKHSKARAKRDDGREDKEVAKEPFLTPEERYLRKEKEVLFYRHKLQRGLLTRDQEPKEDDMASMSEYLAKLEGIPDLEVGIIKKTKINKVLKAILKLELIPKEELFSFKSRSHKMLDKWNKLLAADAKGNSVPEIGANGTPTNAVSATVGEAAGSNGVNDSREVDKPLDVANDKTVRDPEDSDAEGRLTKIEGSKAETTA